MTLIPRLLILLFFIHTGMVQANTDKAQVLFMGSFHFANPGADMVKTDQIDVMSSASQQYLQALAARIADFQPTPVLLEYAPQDDERINAQYQAYLAGHFTLPANEIYQLGFRIAMAANLKRVEGFDERQIQWAAKPLFELMAAHYPKEQVIFQQKIAEITSLLAREHASMTLQALLQIHNNAERDRLNKALYLSTNHLGAGENFEGADAAASWWHRNFRMYANIQRHAIPGSRVFALGGQGHIAILRDLLALDDQRREVSIQEYL
ncbi:DUF5694 domain-containing protein [Bowmanella dokdonensis]|uniref:TraB/GumN family protein n=1 Tax=Bowmanella dokdonensis TaxID=751969 RepID=A0A939DMK8_9ALTE|nr:DUF5694 domain-containing protein [Bowmanella dokdonensis]MBN7825412.1 hypothetical protein [Bowmanella dokdonensis]